MVFLISAIARFSIPIIFAKRLKEVNVQTSEDEKKVFTDIVISKPMHMVIHHTGQVISYTEKKVSNAAGKARNGLKRVSEPVRPVVKKMINGIDGGLDKIEPIRKAIEPKLVRESKIKNYEDLIKSHEHLNKRFTRRKKFKR
jgi:hypothetical protein